jgi:hypothetical protein
MVVLTAVLEPSAISVAGLKLQAASSGTPVQSKVSDPL